jgi:hypothetical protein
MTLSRKKRVLVSLWLKWEQLFHALFGVKLIDPDNQLLYYRICRYRGKPIVFKDEEKIDTGDRVVELHLNNRMLFHMAARSRSMVQLAAQLIHLFKQLLPQITDMIVHDPDCREVKGIYGVTMIHYGGEQLGFTLKDLPQGWFSILTRFYLKLLLYVLHPEGKDRIKTKKNALTPKIVAMSTKELLQKYPV